MGNRYTLIACRMVFLVVANVPAVKAPFRRKMEAMKGRIILLIRMVPIASVQSNPPYIVWQRKFLKNLCSLICPIMPVF